VYRVEEIEEFYRSATKTVAAPWPLSPAGVSREAGQVARRPQQPAAICHVSERSAPRASGA